MTPRGEANRRVARKVAFAPPTVLPTLSTPALVIHAADETIPIQCGRDLADRIPDARWLEVAGADHAPWATEPDRILTSMIGPLAPLPAASI